MKHPGKTLSETQMKTLYNCETLVKSSVKTQVKPFVKPR